MASKPEFNHRIGEETELRLIEPQDAEELDSLIEQNRTHLKEYSAWLKDDHSIENTRSFIERNLAQLPGMKGLQLLFGTKEKWPDRLSTTTSTGPIGKRSLGSGSELVFKAKGSRPHHAGFLFTMHLMN